VARTKIKGKNAERGASVDAIRPTPERLKHAGGQSEVFRTDGAVTVRFTDGVLDQLAARGKISKAQHDAGERFYTHYYLSGIGQDRARPLAQERVDCAGARLDSESQLHHKQQFNAGLKSLDVTVAGVVLGVVLDDRPIEQVGGFTGYSSRRDRITAGMVCLRIGLDQLAEHFGLIPRRRRRYVHQRPGYFTEVREDMWETQNSVT